MKLFLILGAVHAMLAVMLGAFGAHALEAKLTERNMLGVYQTGVQYHMYHALALLAVGILLGKWPASALLNGAGWSFFIGILLFSGSLYALSNTGMKFFGPITPLGGVAFIVGWILLIIAVVKA
ncbi:DUF423 domain-containing protein [Fictibacillus barbaricus]|jgi:uncharacterized membrane protein YgdD (TMEM256/DUF423 family)|uniref:DUF423 domain-containing protein n=1 Tax=Fictibacillus barbaricus TaxID=182136 RepID=A0ABS2ZET2_9BACL|nr:DUF423 domain-containing protein [Fictibacillus barbaricus]MBN3546286.1 DUF423 domain-containing protein [Fictibacillus barbaricus]GGB39944.1 membrane protein [Fictibacillus barbaricus]